MPRHVFRPVIRFASWGGCVNRPFYHIVVTDPNAPREGPIFEQVGTYDPLPNKHDEKLVGLNFDRIQNWLSRGAYMSRPVKELLGLSGFLPVHPNSVMHARRKQIAGAVLDRVEAGDTVTEDDVPPLVKYHKYHVIYDRIYIPHPECTEQSRVDYNNFHKTYRSFSKYSPGNTIPLTDEVSGLYGLVRGK